MNAVRFILKWSADKTGHLVSEAEKITFFFVIQKLNGCTDTNTDMFLPPVTLNPAAECYKGKEERSARLITEVMRIHLHPKA